MDVVSREVTRLHGTIDLASQPGLGTTLTIRLPVRLALEQVMVVRIDGQAFAAPLALVDLAQPFEAGDQRGHGAEATVQVQGDRVRLVDARDAARFLHNAPGSQGPKLLQGPRLGRFAGLAGGCNRWDPRAGAQAVEAAPGGTPVDLGDRLLGQRRANPAADPGGAVRAGLSRADSPLGPPKNDVVRQAPILLVDDSLSVRKVVARKSCTPSALRGGRSLTWPGSVEEGFGIRRIA